jgi:uncharacterized damage-inducible protein DinB
MNTSIKNYVRQINQLYEGDNWAGESFLGKLKPLDENLFFTQPFSGKHSVAEILWHSIYWRTVVVKRIKGDNEFEERTADEQNFLPLESLRKKGLSGLLNDLRKSQDELINILNSSQDDFLDLEYKPGNTNESQIEGIIQHDYYHLGQIGFVISVLKSREYTES